MSGVMRNIVSDIAEECKTGASAMAEMTPQKIRMEKGTAQEDRMEEKMEGKDYEGGK